MEVVFSGSITSAYYVTEKVEKNEDCSFAGYSEYIFFEKEDESFVVGGVVFGECGSGWCSATRERFYTNSHYLEGDIADSVDFASPKTLEVVEVPYRDDYDPTTGKGGEESKHYLFTLNGTPVLKVYHSTCRYYPDAAMDLQMFPIEEWAEL